MFLIDTWTCFKLIYITWSSKLLCLCAWAIQGMFYKYMLSYHACLNWLYKPNNLNLTASCVRMLSSLISRILVSLPYVLIINWYHYLYLVSPPNMFLFIKWYHFNQPLVFYQQLILEDSMLHPYMIELVVQTNYLWFKW